MMRESEVKFLEFWACMLSFNAETVGLLRARNNVNLRGVMFNELPYILT